MNVVNLIPMAGEGKRFKDEGYSTPKPLIEVNGKPMVVRALQSLPIASKNILIVRKDHLDVELLKKTLIQYFENIVIIEIDYLTKGQAATCLLAENEVPQNSILNIGACDLGFKYNLENYQIALKEFDSFIWTYKNNKNVLTHPEMYGWVKRLNNTNLIEYVSCKKPISTNLLKDDVVSGTFTFNNSDNFFEGIRKMIDKNDRVNNEFYLDNIFNHLDGKLGILQLVEYYSWGTPNELINYLKK